MNQNYWKLVNKGDLIFGIDKLDIDLISSFNPSIDKIEIIEGVVKYSGLNKFNSLFVDLEVKKNNPEHTDIVSFSQDNSFIGKTYQEVLKKYLNHAIPFIKTFDEILNKKVEEIKNQLDNMKIDLVLLSVEDNVNLIKEKTEENIINFMLLNAEKKVKTTEPSFKELDMFGNTTRYD